MMNRENSSRRAHQVRPLIEPSQERAVLERWRCMHWGVVMLATIFPMVSAQADNKIELSLYAPPSSLEVERAGKPGCHFFWAQRQVDRDYAGYYVGGGAAAGCSRGQFEEEGTWGWDYTGRLFKRRVNLGWFWMHRKQGGSGSYQPDGPRVVESIKHRLESH